MQVSKSAVEKARNRQQLVRIGAQEQWSGVYGIKTYTKESKQAKQRHSKTRFDDATWGEAYS